MTTDITQIMAAIEAAIMKGDLTALTPEQRLHYYKQVCDSTGLNPLTKPFAFITFPGSKDKPPATLLYATKDCAFQLAAKHQVSVRVTKKEFLFDGKIYAVEVEATSSDGRCFPGTGVLSLVDYTGKILGGLMLSNALMKCETKAIRRAILAITGCGFLDESELDSIEGSTYDAKQTVLTATENMVEELKPAPMSVDLPASAGRVSQLDDLLWRYKINPELLQKKLQLHNVTTTVQLSEPQVERWIEELNLKYGDIAQ